MYLAKRKNGIYYIQYFNEEENRARRISTGKRKKNEALKFLSEFKSKLNAKKVRYILIEEFKDEYVSFIGDTHSESYLRSIKLSFNQFIRFTGNIPLKQIKVSILYRNEIG